MMDKPKMKREVVISDILPIARGLYLFASANTVAELGEFGEIKPYPTRGDDCYLLQVDPRFDFNEVVKWIEEYGGK